MPYKEVMEFETNGTYRHLGYTNNIKLFDEAGKWTASSSSYEIEIQPDSIFTQFYDPMTHNFSFPGKPFISYVYFPNWPLTNLTAFSLISASPNYEYCLKRQK